MEEVSNIQVPSTVQAILAARIDRLLPEDKRLLQTASVIGMNVPYPLLAAITEMNEEELQRGLATLQATEFFYETNLFPEREFTFKHALTHEVAYGSLIQERKRILHAAIVEVVEKVSGDQTDEYVEHLAHHAYEGGVWDKAATYLWMAGEKAIARSIYQDAVRFLERALVGLSHLPETDETRQHGIDIRFDLRSWLQPLGEQKRTFEQLRESVDAEATFRRQVIEADYGFTDGLLTLEEAVGATIDGSAAGSGAA